MSNKIPRLLTINEVAKLFSLNPMTIYRKARSGDIPAIKFGKSWRIPEDELATWIKSKTGNKQLTAINLASIPQIKLVYFFGSSAGGTATPLSDIDIAYLDDGSVSSFDLEQVLEKAILEKFPNVPRIDMVRLNQSPVSIQYKVVREGKLLYQLSDKARADFEEDVVNRYLDYAPVLNQFYKEAA